VAGPDTFQARDLMAPAAARLAAGDPVSWAGPEVPPSTLVRLRLPGVRRTEAGLVLSVLAVDPFGAVHLSARGWAGLAPGAWVRLRLPGRSRPVRARCTRTYAEVAVGEPCLLVDSSGWLTLAVNRGDARSRFHLHPGMRLTLQREAEGKAPP
jgi:S-adenosylmethionine hydrolase